MPSLIVEEREGTFWLEGASPEDVIGNLGQVCYQEPCPKGSPKEPWSDEAEGEESPGGSV